MMRFTPLYDRVVIQPDVTENVSAGGIILTDTNSKPFQQGVVLATGNGTLINGTLTELTVKPGDTVMYIKAAARELTIDTNKYDLIQEKDILGIVS